MTARTLCLVSLCAAFVCGQLAIGNNTLAADNKEDSQPSASHLLPATTVAYIEVPKLANIVEVVAKHPLRERIESLPAFEAVKNSDQYTKLEQAIGAVEGGMGAPWETALAQVSDGGIAIALDRATQGAALLVRSSDRDRLTRLRDFFLALSQLGGGDVGLVQKGEYRGYTAHALTEKLKMALVDDWLLITNRPELGKSIIDRHVDGSDTNLAGSENFRIANRQRSSESVFAFVDLDAVREAKLAPALYRDKTENVVAEALFGAIAANLQHAPYATAAVNVETSGIRVKVATPHEPEWTRGREYFIGENQSELAPELLDVPERIFASSTYRDLSQMWLLAPDLMTDKANEDLAKADTNLTTFFSGRDFGEDILGSLDPQIQLVVARQKFSESNPIPAIKLPEFALQFRMRDPVATTKEFKRVFQSLIGFINVVGAMQDQPQFDLDNRTEDGVTLVNASYVPPQDEKDRRAAAINYNFSPTVAFAGERMILGSTTSIVEKVLASKSGQDSSHSNTAATLNARNLVAVLSDNRSQLVAQNMLEKGHSPDQAEAEIGVLFDLLSLFKDLSLQLDVGEGRMQLSSTLRVESN